MQADTYTVLGCGAHISQIYIGGYRFLFRVLAELTQ